LSNRLSHTVRVFAGALIVCTGCTSILAPRPETTHFFILNVSVPTPQGPSGTNQFAVSQEAIGLGPISFPQYLARAEIVTRTTDNRVQFSSQDRWAEPLDVTFKRVLAQDLSRALEGRSVVEFPSFSVAGPITYRVQASVNQFEADASGTIRLSASWSVVNTKQNRVVYDSTSNLSIPAAPNPSAAAAALSEAIGRFAEQVAAEINLLRGAAISLRGAPFIPMHQMSSSTA